MQGLRTIRLRPYQSKIVKQIIEGMKYRDFILVMMPTGSGKTVVQMALSRSQLGKGTQVLVLEPTRFLADQMQKVWETEFGGQVEKHYEGHCQTTGKPIVISTPKTAGKCASHWGRRSVLIVDEVHHLLTSRSYEETINKIMDEMATRKLIGFTALAESGKLHNFLLSSKKTGVPMVLKYSFRELEKLGGYNPPLAIADLFESEMSLWEKEFLHKLKARPLDAGVREHKIRLLAATYLVKYGYRVACTLLESHGFKSGFEVYCERQEEDHKQRTLGEVLETFSGSPLHPTIMFTWSKHHAKLVANMLENNPAVHSNNVYLITGETSKEERLRLLRELRDAESPIIVSTSVGEEGFDLPDAGLLIFLDIPRSELRFYQRLGRLLRRSRKHVLKYLVLLSTPYTFEHVSLSYVLWSLHREGVDVTYILRGLEEIVGKTAYKTVEDLVKHYASLMGTSSIPYLTLRRGASHVEATEALGELEAPPRHVAEALNKVYSALSIIYPYRGEATHFEKYLQILIALKILRKWTPEKYGLEHMLKHLNQDLEDKFRLVDKTYSILTKGVLTKTIIRAVNNGNILVSFDPSSHSEVIAPALYVIAQRWEEIVRTGKHRRRQTLYINNPIILLPTSLLTPSENVEQHIQWLSQILDETLPQLRNVYYLNGICWQPQGKTTDRPLSKKHESPPRLLCNGTVDASFARLAVQYSTSFYNTRHFELQRELLAKSVQASLALATLRVQEVISQQAPIRGKLLSY